MFRCRAVARASPTQDIKRAYVYIQHPQTCQDIATGVCIYDRGEGLIICSSRASRRRQQLRDTKRDAQMTRESCSNRTVLCPICLCECLYMCIFVCSASLTIGFAKILTALAHILEERGHILQYQWHDWARQAVSGCYIPTAIFNSLMWKKCRSRQTDSSTHEPSIYASVPQYCVLSHHQCLSWEDLWT